MFMAEEWSIFQMDDAKLQHDQNCNSWTTFSLIQFAPDQLAEKNTAALSIS